MGVSDVNWLLAALLQSGAALVAIVGGLIGARFVGLHAEQQAARRRLAELGLRLVSEQALADTARRALQDYRVRDLLDDPTCYEYLIQNKEPITLDALLGYANRDEQDLPRELLQARFELMVEELDRAVVAMRDSAPSPRESIEWPTFRRLQDLQPRHEGIWEWTFHELVKQRGHEERALQRNQMRGTPLEGLAGLDIPAYPLPFIPSSGWAVARTATLNRLASEASAADARVAVRTAEVEAAREHVVASTQPDGFGLAIEVLSALCVLTVVLPLVLLVLGPEHLNAAVRISVGLAFLLGVGLLLQYWRSYAVFLRQGVDPRPLPEHIWRLLPFVSGKRR